MSLPTLLAATLALSSPSPLVATTGVTPAFSRTQDSSKELEQKASEIRDQSTADWRAGRFKEAASKLEEALTIYSGLSGNYLAERFICLRAITWNQMDAGDLKLAFEAFTRLSKLSEAVTVDANLKSELQTAYNALATGANREKEATAGLDILEDTAKILRGLKLDDMVGQARHDQALLAAGSSQPKRKVEQYHKHALALREKLDDEVGIAWTQNSWARYSMGQGDFKEAGERFLHAYGNILEDDAAEPQAAIAGGILEWLEQLSESSDISKSTVELAWKIGELTAEANTPRILASSHVQAAAAALQSGLRGKNRALLAARRLNRTVHPGQPTEVATDVTLRAADLAVAHAPKEALGWLNEIDSTTGPCAPLLRARRARLTAIAHAYLEDPVAFDLAAKEAMQAYEEVDYHPIVPAALESIVQSAQKLNGSQTLAGLKTELSALKRKGSPGGRGGSSSSRGVASGIDKLSLHAPVFELRYADGQIMIHDLLGGDSGSTDTEWRPHNYSFNGLALRVWGGYVTVLSMNYGGNTSAHGGRGGKGLQDLAIDFRPIPETGALVIAKNGAVSYRLQD